MDTNSEYCITTGEFARLCNTTRDTLRYYDKMGVLIPKKNNINGYKYYSSKQVTSFFFINLFSTFGCPIKELRHIVGGDETAQFDTFLNAQYETLLKTREELEYKIQILQLGIELIKHATTNPANTVIYEQLEKPIQIILTDVTSSPATTSGEISADILAHINYCRNNGSSYPFPIGAVIDYNDLTNGIYRYKQVFSMSNTPLSGESIYTLPTNNVVSCVHKDSDGSINNVYKSICDYIKNNNMQAKSDLYSLSLVNIVDTHEERRYLKYLFVCV